MKKEDALKDYLEEIKQSWTWARLSEEEKKVFEKRINCERFISSIKGNYNARWNIISNYYFMFLLGLGFDNPMFAFAFVVSCIISYDSMGVRLETEKQAKVIKELGKKHNLDFKLKEHLGHKMNEVIVGYIYGIFIAYLFSLI